MSKATHYRPGVGIVLVNRQGLVLVGHRRDNRPSPWQMPQGGLGAGEQPEAAAIRELTEELGTRHARILDGFPDWLRYDYPREFRTCRAKCFRGQQHRWFLMSFTGIDDEIAVETAHPEFDDWRWQPPMSVIEAVVSFKRKVYREVLTYFAPAIAQLKRAHTLPVPLLPVPAQHDRADLITQLAADSRAAASISSSVTVGL